MAKALIEDCKTGEGYVVENPWECRDTCDKSAYEAFISMGGREPISMGSIIVSRAKGKERK
jgi:hypothetical protein